MTLKDIWKPKLETAISRLNTHTFDGDIDFARPPIAANKSAAVLVLVNLYDTPSITLTVRQSHMRKHAGQIAFAGGSMDETDTDLWHTAHREAHEEIGLPLEHPLLKLGSLPDHHTITHYVVTPFVAINTTPFEQKPEPSEVAEIFELPLEQLRPENFRIDHHLMNGHKRKFYVLPFHDYYIWGATARILHNLTQGLSHVTD